MNKSSKNKLLESNKSLSYLLYYYSFHKIQKIIYFLITVNILGFNFVFNFPNKKNKIIRKNRVVRFFYFRFDLHPNTFDV